MIKIKKYDFIVFRLTVSQEENNHVGSNHIQQGTNCHPQGDQGTIADCTW